MRGRLALALALMLTSGAAAEPLELEQVVGLVLTQHPALESQRNSVAESRARVEIEGGRFDWLAFAEGSFERREVIKDKGGQLLNDTNTVNIYGGRLGVSKQFRNGITVRPGFAVFNSVGDDAEEVLTETKTAPVITVTWPLLRGAGKHAAAGERAARSDVVASEFRARHERRGLLHLAVRAHWQALAAGKRLEVVQLLEGHVARARETTGQLVQRGELAPLAGQEAEADLALRRLEVGQARSGWLGARRELALAVGQETANVEALPQAAGGFPRVVLLPDNGGPSEAALIQGALLDRPDILTLRQRASSEDIRAAAAKNGLLPEVNLILEQTGVRLKVAHSLRNSAAEGRLGVARAVENQIRVDLTQRMRQLKTDVQTILERLRLSGASYELALRTNELLQGIADDKARQGENGPGADLATLAKLARVQRQIVDANLEYALALADLRYVTGRVDDGEEATPARVAQQFQNLPAER